MPCKYGEFSFPAQAGFSGSAGQTMVKGYARGGKVTPATAPAVAKKLAAHAALPAGRAHKGTKGGC